MPDRRMESSRARSAASSTPTTLPDEPRDRLVWAVMLHGSFPGTCVITPTGSSACPTGRTAKLVIVDGQTGAFLVSVSS